MIVAAPISMAMLGWLCCLMYSDARSARATATRAAATRATIALGLEDDPDQWPAARGDWTALDEYQLIRLLTGSAPARQPTTNPPDHAVPHDEHEDTA